MSAQATQFQDPLVELRPEVVPLPPALLRARTSFRGAVEAMLAVPDAALEGGWQWRATDPEPADIRYGLYRITELLEEAATRIARDTIAREAIAPAVPPLAAATAARWSLQGAIAGLGDDTWDADPGNGEWSVRRTMGHIVASQRGYGWYTAWYVHCTGTPDAGSIPPKDRYPPEIDEDVESLGTRAEIAARFDQLVDAALERYANLRPAELASPARWSGLPVTVDFRMARPASHIREHTIQIEKTLAMLGYVPSEVQRITRLACDAYGRLEALAFVRGEPAASVVEETAAEVARTAASVQEAAASAQG
jgi:DinB superfamily